MTPLCPVGRLFCSEPCTGPLHLNRRTRDFGTLYHMSFLTQLNVAERIPIQRSSNEHYKHNEKEKTKRKLKRSQDTGYSTNGAQISSAYSFVPIAIFFAAPFHRSSKWLAARCLLASRFLVFFLFGVVLARPFFPIFRQRIPKRCKGVWFLGFDSKTVQRV